MWVLKYRLQVVAISHVVHHSCSVCVAVPCVLIHILCIQHLLAMLQLLLLLMPWRKSIYFDRKNETAVVVEYVHGWQPQLAMSLMIGSFDVALFLYKCFLALRSGKIYMLIAETVVQYEVV